MKEQSLQKELFKEFEEPKKKVKKTDTILPKNYILFNVSYEQIIFITIGIIMLMVLLFSLGVERGKRLIYSKVSKEETRAGIVSIEDLKKDSTSPGPLVTETSTPEPKDEEAKIIEPKEEKGITSAKLFTIQVIAYRSKRSAQDELIKLSKKGFSPFIIVGGGYYQICVGEYRDQDEAKGDLLELKKVYKDSFIRKR